MSFFMKNRARFSFVKSRNAREVERVNVLKDYRLGRATPADLLKILNQNKRLTGRESPNGSVGVIGTHVRDVMSLPFLSRRNDSLGDAVPDWVAVSRPSGYSERGKDDLYGSRYDFEYDTIGEGGGPTRWGPKSTPRIRASGKPCTTRTEPYWQGIIKKPTIY